MYGRSLVELCLAQWLVGCSAVVLTSVLELFTSCVIPQRGSQVQISMHSVAHVSVRPGLKGRASGKLITDPTRFGKPANEIPVGVAIEQKPGRVVRIEAGIFESLHLHLHHSRGDAFVYNEIVSGAGVACGEVSGKHHTIDNLEPAQRFKGVWCHVPITSNDPWASEGVQAHGSGLKKSHVSVAEPLRVLKARCTSHL